MLAIYMIAIFAGVYILNIVWLKGIIKHAKRNLNKAPEGPDDKEETVKLLNEDNEENYNSITEPEEAGSVTKDLRKV
jgi:hypothetical protein